MKVAHVPAAVAGLTPLRKLEPEHHLKLAVGLPLRNQNTLDELLRELYDPGSPSYRHWLTPEQFTEQFGSSEENYRALQDFVVAHGLTITFRHPNRLVLDVEGAVKDIEQAFNATLHVYRHPTEEREFYAPSIEPSLDLVVPILDISGLDDFSLPKPRLKQKILPQTPPLRPKGGSGPSGSYRGADFRAAYVPGSALTGAGQSVGLLQFDGYYVNDITTYESQAGLPNVTLVNVPVDGGVSSPGSGNSEVCLDIEMVISMAPGISTIYLYEAPNPSPWVDLLSRMANDNLAKQLSCSWGGGGVNASAEQIFKQMGSQGQSFFNASGDSDAFTSTVPFPSDSTNITQVGGTTLSTTGPGGAYVSETVWNWGLVQGSYTGSSGGVSPYYGIPDYQLGISMVANQGSTTKRNVPDVALTADNLYVVYNNGSASAGFGGTSAAAPLWAALTALINQQAAANGSPSVGFLNPALYSIGKGGNYASCFHDITTGNNFSSSSPSKYSAVAGYDLCTGWGTPIGNGLINALSGPPAPQIVSNSFTLAAESCPNSAVDPAENVTMTFGLKNIGSVNTTNVVATLQSGGGVSSPSGPQTYGALTSAGAAVNRSFSFVANGACGGTLTATLQLQDGAANLGTVAFSLRMGQVSSGVSFAQNFDSSTPPSLPASWSRTVVSGGQADWVTSAAASDTSPNSAFGADAASSGANALVSPVISIATPSAQLTFRHNYNLESHTRGHTTTYYDGGILEIKIGSGAFTDILAAGGSFVSGGYNCTLASSTGNTYGGSQAWGGNSAGWTTTVVNLPAGALGQNVQFRWVVSTDSSNVDPAVGWYVDSVSLQDGTYVCCTPGANIPPAITTQPTGQVVVAGANVSFAVSATGTVPLNYQWYFNNAPVGTNGPSLGLSNVQASQAGPYKVVITNSAGSVTSAVANLTVLVPPTFTLQPSNKTVVAGSNVSLNASATGSLPLTYQWYFNGASPVGTNGPILGFSNVQSAQAGPYRLVVTNSAGAATSSIAMLTVLTRPTLVSPRITITGSFTFVLQGDTGQNYAIEATTNFQTWQQIGSVSNATGQTPFVETNSSGHLFRLYRARWLP